MITDFYIHALTDSGQTGFGNLWAHHEMVTATLSQCSREGTEIECAEVRDLVRRACIGNAIFSQWLKLELEVRSYGLEKSPRHSNWIAP